MQATKTPKIHLLLLSAILLSSTCLAAPPTEQLENADENSVICAYGKQSELAGGAFENKKNPEKRMKFSGEKPLHDAVLLVDKIKNTNIWLGCVRAASAKLPGVFCQVELRKEDGTLINAMRFSGGVAAGATLFSLDNKASQDQLNDPYEFQCANTNAVDLK